MNPSERLAVIRARLKQPGAVVPKAAGMHRAGNPDAPQPKKRKPYRRNEAGYRAYSYGVGGDYAPTSDNRPPWVYQPDKAKPVQCATKRTKRTHPLIRIAEKWMGNRRFTRLTNAFSKKVENHEAMLAVFFFYYNFCRIHQTLRVTPAMQAGITNKVWELSDMVSLLDNRTEMAA